MFTTILRKVYKTFGQLFREYIERLAGEIYLNYKLKNIIYLRITLLQTIMRIEIIFADPLEISRKLPSIFFFQTNCYTLQTIILAIS